MAWRSRAAPGPSTASPWTWERLRSCSACSIWKRGEQIADTSFENPQRFGGSDVMARISYDGEHRGLLMRTLAGYLTRAIEELPVDPRSIYEMVVVGNSTMRDLFFGKSVYTHRPESVPVDHGNRDGGGQAQHHQPDVRPGGVPAADPSARRAFTGLPVISGHVGADAAACMLAVDIAHEDRLVAVMDIGTNTELILGNRHRILAASCPAGPAFEGGAIACGMPALDGAIEDVALDERRRLPTRRDRRYGAPQGICGSGLVDLMSELLRTGRMNSMGRFEDDGQRITVDAANDIFFLESDVNELAQAKGANVAGLQVVCSAVRHRFRRDRSVLSGGRLRPAPEGGGLAPHRSDSESARTRESCRPATLPSKARASRCSRARGAGNWRSW